MFSRAKATIPPPMKTKRQSKMIGRRVNPNASRPFSTVGLSKLHERAAWRLLGCHRQRVAQEQRPFGSDQLADLQPLEDLPIALELQAGPDLASGEAATVRR